MTAPPSPATRGESPRPQPSRPLTGEQPTLRRYVGLDGLRFAAALVVVLHHVDVFTRDWLGHGGTISTKTFAMVDLFFVLSGFVMMHTYSTSVRGMAGYRWFLRKRLARIYPLHVITLLVAVGVVVLRERVTGTAIGDELAQVPLQLALLHATGLTQELALNRPSWSISAEFVCYLLFPLFALVLGRRRPAAALGAAVLIALALSVVDTLVSDRAWTRWSHDYGVLRAVPSFVAGIGVCLWLDRRRSARITARHAEVVLVLFVLAVAFAPPLVVMATVVAVVGLVAAAERNRRAGWLGRPIMGRLGDLSYGTYMWHFPILMVVMAAARRLAPEGHPVAVVGAALLIVGATLVTAYASFHWFEAPMRRRLTRGARPPAGLDVAADHREPASGGRRVGLRGQVSESA